jgi:hypothetical protein
MSGVVSICLTPDDFERPLGDLTHECFDVYRRSS